MAVNYQMDVINPFQAALQGYGAGAQMLQQERTAERQVRQDEQQGQLFGLQMQEAQAKAAKVQQEIKAAQERDTVYGEFYDAVEAGKLTPQLVAKVTTLDEKLGTFGAGLLENMTAEQQLVSFNNLMAPATALATGDVEAAKANLQTQYDAFVNSGNEQSAQVVKGYLDQLGTPQGQTFVQAALLRGASMMNPEGFETQLANITALKGEKETEATQTARAYAATFGPPGSPEYMRAFRTKLLPPPAPGTVVNVGGEGRPLSELQKALDKKFAEDTMLPFITGGATNDIAKMDKLADAIATLEANPQLTGPYIGWLPDAALAIVSPDLLATKETIQDVASANLKLILGGQFGEKEGANLVNRAFNQTLPASENIRRAKRMLTQIQAANEDIRRAIAYVENPENKGSLQGFEFSTKTGKNWTEQDFINAIEGKNQPATINFKSMNDDTLLAQDLSKLNREQRTALNAELTERGYD